MPKKIIHVDMDCFYAQVEMRDNPHLKDVPLAIGGLPGTRSVLCTSNYIARKFGVKSAMPTDYAIKLCPHLTIIPPDFKKYSRVSEIIHAIFYHFSKVVEPVSLDEAYLDVSNEKNATNIAIEIKKKIFAHTELTASIGVAPNKFLAKIASDWKKPNGLFVIPPSHVESFVKILPVNLIPGIGKKGQNILKSLDVATCSDLEKIPPEIMRQHFGKFGHELYQYAKGIDLREVISNWERKSLSVETTFSKDIADENLLLLELNNLYDEMLKRINAHFKEEGKKKIRKYFVKVKFNDFSKTSSEETIHFHTEVNWEEYLQRKLFPPLLSRCLKKKGIAVRLIGLGVRFFTKEDFTPIQLSLFPMDRHESF